VPGTPLPQQAHFPLQEIKGPFPPPLSKSVFFFAGRTSRRFPYFASTPPSLNQHTPPLGQADILSPPVGKRGTTTSPPFPLKQRSRVCPFLWLPLDGDSLVGATLCLVLPFFPTNTPDGNFLGFGEGRPCAPRMSLPALPIREQEQGFFLCDSLRRLLLVAEGNGPPDEYLLPPLRGKGRFLPRCSSHFKEREAFFFFLASA